MRTPLFLVGLLGVVFAACGGRTDGVTDGGNAFALGGSGGSAGAGYGACTEGLACPAGKACSVAIGTCATTCKCDGGGHYACTTECATGGSAGSAGSPNGYAECTAPGQCQIAGKSCCGTCGQPTTGNSVAIASSSYGAYEASLCGGGPVACPACPYAPNGDLAAFCRTDLCGLVEVSKDVISECNTDADCVVRRSGCCDCPSPNPADYIALATSGTAEYTAQLCGQAFGCDCANNAPPPGLGATCNPATKHCQVVEGKPSCPTTPPLPGTSCVEPPSGVCEYGNSLVIGCRQHYTCNFGSWQLQTGQACSPVDPVGVNGCPPTTSVNGQVCGKDGQVCALPASAVCECASCGGGGPCTFPPKWECASPPGGLCPNLAPDTGQPCGSAGAICNYGAPCSQTSAVRQCSGGVWVNLAIACEG